MDMYPFDSDANEKDQILYLIHLNSLIDNSVEIDLAKFFRESEGDLYGEFREKIWPSFSSIFNQFGDNAESFADLKKLMETEIADYVISRAKKIDTKYTFKDSLLAERYFEGVQGAMEAYKQSRVNYEAALALLKSDDIKRKLQTGADSNVEYVELLNKMKMIAGKNKAEMQRNREDYFDKLAKYQINMIKQIKIQNNLEGLKRA